ncbi:3,4-dihydroxyphenylacetate 2,3-dioxygenase [Salmonella enterica subsp. arizonae]|uniref:3,4-dihydroxyphenylacetate 2,3-dioxygenase n=1 Tax=Salmonella enterica subsp. arizonae TaxID=59203 RepID=A0A379S592_SALER|nr:3,4-dihydroxyphenylacetate 2,3-dioxygenase [Salmonella enterica subsp. arizonae]
MYLSELPGKNYGCRQAAIDGHIEIGKRCREMGVDTIIVFDTHWLVNSAYHINCADHFQGGLYQQRTAALYSRHDL